MQTAAGTAHTSESGATYSAIIIAALLGEYSLLIMPFIVTGMMRGFGVDEGLAGTLVSAQLGTMAIAGIVVAYSLQRIPARTIAIAAAALVIIANALCALGGGVTALVIGRCLTGLGEGALMAAAGGIAARAANPHRLFSLLGLVIACVAAIALITTSYLFELLGGRGVFWLLAGSPIAVLLTAAWLPGGLVKMDDAPSFGALRIPGALRVLLAFALMWIGASALWVFAERIGTSQGLSLAKVGTALAIGQVAGILGPLLAASFGERAGLRLSLFAGCAAMIAGSLAMVYGHGVLLYTLGGAVLSGGIMFLTPCFRSLMAGLDQAGSVVALSVAFYTVGFGAAPLLVSGLHGTGDGYGSIAAIAVAAFALSGVLAFSVKPAAR